MRVFITKEKVCINVDSDTDAQRLLKDGAYELPQKEVEKIFSSEAAQAGPKTVTVTLEEGETDLSKAKIYFKKIEIDTDVLWAKVRVQRDSLLAKSDWTQLADSPLTETKIAAWATYRQSLRDITDDYASPDKVVWPNTP